MKNIATTTPARNRVAAPKAAPHENVDIAALQKQLADLQAKYDADTARFKKVIKTILSED